MHGRLHWNAPDELDSEQRDLYDAVVGGPRAQGRQAFPLTDDSGRLHGPFNAMLANPALGKAMAELGAVLRFRGALSHRERELAILELAARRRSNFEWYAHVRIARASGVSDDEIAAIERDAPVATFDARESLARDVVRALVVAGDLDDALFSRAKDAFGERDLVELIVLAGYYDLLARLMHVCRVPLPEGEVAAFGDDTGTADEAPALP